jgi:hypothetical protein
MATNQASSSSGGADEGVLKLMERLGINEEDLDDVVLEEEEQPPVEATRWLATAKVFTNGEYSSFWFFKNMRSILMSRCLGESHARRTVELQGQSGAH